MQAKAEDDGGLGGPGNSGRTGYDVEHRRSERLPSVDQADFTKWNPMAAGVGHREEFSAALKPPAPTLRRKGRGPRITSQIHRRRCIDRQLGPLSASRRKSAGTDCPAQRYDKAGQYEYHCDVPASSLVGTLVNTDFALDKVLPATETDQRRSGLVVATCVGLSRSQVAVRPTPSREESPGARDPRRLFAALRGAVRRPL